MAFTYFFRDLHTLEGAVKHVAPHLAGRSKAHVWDAGCAMGPEPYSLAILFAETMGRFAFRNLAIFGSDIDTSSLFEKTISEGLYPEQELSRIPRPLFKKYFSQSEIPGQCRINENIRNRVTYQRHDLLTLQPIQDGLSLIVCKNVLLHFQPSQRIDVIRMFHRVLLPDGIFVMEQTQMLPKKCTHLFNQVRADMQLFQKKAG